MSARRHAALGLLAALLGGCALVAGLYEPRPLHCSNGVHDKDSGETGVDCGGECPLCKGEDCNSDDECLSRYCANGKCDIPDCSQGSDIPCDQCRNCGEKKPCASNLDCNSGRCVNGKCAGCTSDDQCQQGGGGVCRGEVCLNVTCYNGAQNLPEETGVDCGGACQQYLDKACATGGAGGMGTGGTGTGGTGTGGTGTGGTGGTGATGGTGTGGTGNGGTGGTGTGPCSNGAKDGLETDVDCGGGTCPTCGTGKTCTQNSDCASSVCASGNCNAPTCNDMVHNGNETDVDCGGGCPTCDDGNACALNTDCTKSSCQNGLCQPAHCGNGAGGIGETDIDCGGLCFTKCANGKTCAIDADCASNKCSVFFQCVQ